MNLLCLLAGHKFVPVKTREIVEGRNTNLEVVEFQIQEMSCMRCSIGKDTKRLDA
jgi:hypothetical protein